MTMSTSTGTHVQTTELTERECWEYLAEHDFGRIAVMRDGELDIYPVSYAVAPGGLRIRTRFGGKLMAILLDGRVAFEVDDHDGIRARSVMVSGWAEELGAGADVESSTPTAPFAGSGANAVLLITPSRITGRVIRRDLP
jgi:nitroimidazol reductase NimA-like FMN-containing flavoprotein (pyridoxamine 5'-phosphate oxidase superfamily)